MPKLITPRNLTVINFIIVGYFGMVWLVYILEIENQVIGVARELLTIPFLLAQLVFLVIGVRYLIKNSLPTLTRVSVCALGICAMITIGSFFM